MEDVEPLAPGHLLVGGGVEMAAGRHHGSHCRSPDPSCREIRRWVDRRQIHAKGAGGGGGAVAPSPLPRSASSMLAIATPRPPARRLRAGPRSLSGGGGGARASACLAV